MRIRLTVPLLALLAAVLPLSACGDGTGPSAVDVTGTYTLQTANGASLPATVYEDSDFKFEVLSGSLILTSDKRYREPVSFRFTEKASNQVFTASEEDTGTYTVSGSNITFKSADPDVGTYAGTVNNGTISYTVEGINLVYRK